MGQCTTRLMQRCAAAEFVFIRGRATMADIFSSRAALFIGARMCLSLTLICLVALLVPSAGLAQALAHTCQFNAGPRAGQQQSYPQVQPIPVGSPCQDGAGSTGVAVPDGAGGSPTPQVQTASLSHTCQFNAGPRAGQQQSYPQVQPIPVGSPCQDGVGSTGVAVPDGAGGLPTPQVQTASLSHTCQFNVGPRAGQQQSYPQVQPIPVGSPCQDGAGSTGVAVPDGAGGLPTPQVQTASLSHTCQFNVGPRAGQQQSYPQVQPIPVGSPCQDGRGSTGFAVPDPIQTQLQQSSIFPCPPGMQCVSIPPSKLPVIRPQLTMVWCWVASAQAIFEFYGHDVDQTQIVTQVLGSPVVTTANAPIMLSMLNNTYTDRAGKLFSTRTPQIWDAFSWLSANPFFMQRLGAKPLDNTGIRNALAAGRPLLIGTSHHAMVLVGMAYRQVGPRILPQQALVLDPAPTPLGSATGLRPLLANEMTAYFAADVVVNP